MGARPDPLSPEFHLSWPSLKVGNWGKSTFCPIQPLACAMLKLVSKCGTRIPARAASGSVRVDRPVPVLRLRRWRCPRLLSTTVQNCRFVRISSLRRVQHRRRRLRNGARSNGISRGGVHDHYHHYVGLCRDKIMDQDASENSGGG